MELPYFCFTLLVLTFPFFSPLVDLFECQKQWIQFVLVKPWPAVYSWSVAREGTRVEPHSEFLNWILQGVPKTSHYLNSWTIALPLLVGCLNPLWKSNNFPQIRPGVSKPEIQRVIFCGPACKLDIVLERLKLKSTVQDTRMFVMLR